MLQDLSSVLIGGAALLAAGWAAMIDYGGKGATRFLARCSALLAAFLLVHVSLGGATLHNTAEAAAWGGIIAGGLAKLAEAFDTVKAALGMRIYAGALAAASLALLAIWAGYVRN